MFSRQVNALRRLRQVSRLCARLTRPWRSSYLTMVIRANRLCRRERFTPTEAFRLGLFGPNRRPHGRPAYISRKRLTKIQEALNPPASAPLLRDKGAFYRHCLASGIPVPKLYAVFQRGSPGWCGGGPLLTGPDPWCRFINDELPAQFVVKPTQGAYGRGLRVLTRSGDRFVDHGGRFCSAEQLYDAMAQDGQFSGFVIQQRLTNAPELIGLTGAEALQTVRLITLIARDGSCRILHGHFKPIVGDHIVDTFIDGLTGNVEAPVCLDSGLLGPATQISGDGDGVRTLLHHPATGAAFEGFRLPTWRRACELVRSAAAHFLPVRTIGWDVALTPTGPVIVEGNVWWDPPNQHPSIGPLVETLTAEIPENA